MAKAEKIHQYSRSVDYQYQPTAEYKVRGAYIFLSHIHDTNDGDGLYLNVRMMNHVKSIDAECNIKVWKTGSAVKVLDQSIKCIYEEDTGFGVNQIKGLDNIREVAIILTIKKWIVKAK